MNLSEKIEISAALLPVNYYAATLCLWFGHWFAHQSGSPLRNHHIQSHHRIYPDSQRCRTSRFRLAKGKYDSNKALLPWLVIPLCLELAFLPLWLAFMGVLQLALATIIMAWLHVQFHLEHSALDGRAWFSRARARHEIHHDEDKNFAVGDHFWDRVFGTFVRSKAEFLLSRVAVPKMPPSRQPAPTESKALGKLKYCQCASCDLACQHRYASREASESLHFPVTNSTGIRTHTEEKNLETNFKKPQKPHQQNKRN